MRSRRIRGRWGKDVPGQCQGDRRQDHAVADGDPNEVGTPRVLPHGTADEREACDGEPEDGKELPSGEAHGRPYAERRERTE